MAKRNKQQTRQQKKQLKSEQLKREQLKSEQPKSEQPKSQPQKSEQKKSKSKFWKRIGLFDTYEAALVTKTKLLNNTEGLDVKIGRCGTGGEQFQVKTRESLLNEESDAPVAQ